MTRLSRAFTGDLEIRGDGRTVVGLAVPWDTPTRVSDGGAPYLEQFTRGAFSRTIAERTARVKFLAQHDRQALPIGRATALREDAAGLYAELRVSATAAGDEVLTLIRDGALDGLSIGFRPVTPGPAVRIRPGELVTRTEVRLDEISAVSFPAYEGARIAAVRAASAPPLTLARRRLALARTVVDLAGRHPR